MPPLSAPSRLTGSRQADFLTRINALIAPLGPVRAHAILPPALWQGPFGAFLGQSLGHAPHQPWNTMLLPPDVASARGLNLPVLPLDYPDGFAVAAEAHIGALAQSVADAQRASAGVPDGAARFGQALRAARDDLFAFAHASAIVQFGEDAYQAHLALFGDLLRWEHRDRYLKPLPALTGHQRLPAAPDAGHQIRHRFGSTLNARSQPLQASSYSASILTDLAAAAIQRDRLVDAVNARLAPQAAIIAYDILPAALWNGKASGFLTRTLNVYPAGRGNTLLLPSNEQSAAALGLPVYPGPAGDDVLRLAQREVRRAETQLETGLRDEATLRASFQAFLREQAVAAIGEAGWLRHAGLFGPLLDPDAVPPTPADR